MAHNGGAPLLPGLNTVPVLVVEWGSLPFEGKRLEGFVLDGRFRLDRFLAQLSGAYGLPYVACDLARGDERVFVKILSAWATLSPKAGRELTTAEVLLRVQEAESGQDPDPGAHVARVRAVLRSGRVQRVGEAVAITGVPAVVLDWYGGGDLHAVLFKARRRNQALAEHVARRLAQQLVAGLARMHALRLYHRDVKLENLVLDDHFNLKVRMLGASGQRTGWRVGGDVPSGGRGPL